MAFFMPREKGEFGLARAAHVFIGSLECIPIIGNMVAGVDWVASKIFSSESPPKEGTFDERVVRGQEGVREIFKSRLLDGFQVTNIDDFSDLITFTPAEFLIRLGFLAYSKYCKPYIEVDKVVGGPDQLPFDLYLKKNCEIFTKSVEGAEQGDTVFFRQGYHLFTINFEKKTLKVTTDGIGLYNERSPYFFR